MQSIFYHRKQERIWNSNHGRLSLSLIRREWISAMKFSTSFVELRGTAEWIIATTSNLIHMYVIWYLFEIKKRIKAA